MAVVVTSWALAGSALGAPISGQGTWETTLKARDIAGTPVALNAASAVFYFDTALNITWLRDWNAGAGSAFDDGRSGTDGWMSWDNAVAWSRSLTVGAFGGWRLPMVVDTGTPGCDPAAVFSGIDCGYNVDTSTSELAHMFYVTLGNRAPFNRAGVETPPGLWGLTNTAHFANIKEQRHWSGTEYAPLPSDAWDFDTLLGFQGVFAKVIDLPAVAVRPGDVAAIPEPVSVALLLAGLGVLGATARRAR